MGLRLYQAVVILLVVGVVLTGIQALVQTVDPSTIATELQGAWGLLVYVFTAGPATIFFTFLRNILGFSTKWLATNPEKRGAIQYEANLLGATVTRYAFYIGSLTAMIQAFTVGTPAYPYAANIAGGISVILDLAIGAIKDLSAKPS